MHTERLNPRGDKGQALAFLFVPCLIQAHTRLSFTVMHPIGRAAMNGYSSATQPL